MREIIIAPMREHSRKPDEFYRRAEMFCAGPRLDLFGRQSRSGWTVWGDQSTLFDAPAVNTLPVPEVAQARRAQKGFEGARDKYGEPSP